MSMWRENKNINLRWKLIGPTDRTGGRGRRPRPSLALLSEGEIYWYWSDSNKWIHKAISYHKHLRVGEAAGRGTFTLKTTVPLGYLRFYIISATIIWRVDYEILLLKTQTPLKNISFREIYMFSQKDLKQLILWGTHRKKSNISTTVNN